MINNYVKKVPLFEEYVKMNETIYTAGQTLLANAWNKPLSKDGIVKRINK